MEKLMGVVLIGAQKWSDTNLDVSTFQDGIPIAEISSSEQWAEYYDAGTPGWCHYNFDASNSTLYGKLYNWYAVSSSARIAPEGFRIPTDGDFTTLVTYLGGQTQAGYKMKNTQYWLTLSRRNSNGSNQSGFKGNPGGYLKSSTAEMWDLGWSANYWTATTASAAEVISKRLYWSNNDCVSVNAPTDMGLSVRLICTGSCATGDYDPTNNF
jgi:uncharacterized protein (TIGR02145 family)